MIVHRRLKEATRRREAVLLTGVTMGGGPSGWAAEAHARAGLPIFATPDAARSSTMIWMSCAKWASGNRRREAWRLPEEVWRLGCTCYRHRLLLESFGVAKRPAVAWRFRPAPPPGYSDCQFRFVLATASGPKTAERSYRAEDIPILTACKP
jgi:hypothetical protein